VLGDGTKFAKKKNTLIFADEALRDVRQALPSRAGRIQYSPAAVGRTAKRA
jgi:hypothetical protein